MLRLWFNMLGRKLRFHTLMIMFIQCSRFDCSMMDIKHTDVASHYIPKQSHNPSDAA